MFIDKFKDGQKVKLKDGQKGIYLQVNWLNMKNNLKVAIIWQAYFQI